MSFNLPDPTGCSFFNRPKKRHIAAKVAKKIIGAKAATVAAVVAVPVLIVEQVVVHVMAVSYVAPSYSPLPAYVSQQNTIQGIKGEDNKVYIQEGHTYVPVQPECWRSGT